MLVGDALERGRDRSHLLVEPLEGRVLHLEAARELLDQQAAVRAQDDLRRPELPRALEAAERRGVLGDIVRRDADALGDLVEDLAVLVGDHDADAGGPGVPPRGAVAVQDQAKTTIRRQYSHLFTPSVRLSRSSSTAESFS